MADDIQEMLVKIKGDISDLLAKYEAGKRATKDFEDTVDKSGKNMGSAFKDVEQGVDDVAKTSKKTSSSVKKDAEDMKSKFISLGQGTKGVQENLIQMGVAAAPFLAPVAAGSLLGVLGAGGLALGIAGQLHAAGVQTAIAGLKEDLSTSLTEATSAFGPEMLGAIGDLDKGVSGFIGGLKSGLDTLAPELRPFIKTVSGGLLQAAPLFASAMAKSRPDVQALGVLISDLSVGTGEFFDNLSIGAEGGAQAVEDLGSSLKDLEASLGTALGGVAALYGAIHTAQTTVDNWTHSNRGLTDTFGAIYDAAANIINPFRLINNATKDLTKAFGGSSDSADTFDGSVNSLGVDTRNMAPAVVGASNAVDYLGIAALNAGVPLATTGQAVRSLGEHSGASDPAVQAIGRSVQSMGEHAGTSNLATQALGFTVQSLGEHSGASDPMVLAVGNSMQSMGEHAGTSNLATQALAFSVKSMGEHSGAAIGSLNGADTAIQNTVPDAQALAGAMNDLASAMTNAETQALTLDKANLNLKQAQADLGSTLKKNKDNWDQNTQAGRDDWGQLLTTLGAIQKVHDAQVANGGATEANTAAYYKNVDGLLAVAKKAGLSKQQIALLKQQFEELPRSVNIPVTVKVRVAESDAAAQLIGRVTGQRVATANSGIYPSNMQRYANSGIAHFDASGVYPGIAGGMYRMAEASVGDEALIARTGDKNRALSSLGTAASWFGGTVVLDRNNTSPAIKYAGGNGSGSGPVFPLYATIEVDGKAVVRALTSAAQKRGHRNGGVTGLG